MVAPNSSTVIKVRAKATGLRIVESPSRGEVSCVGPVVRSGVCGITYATVLSVPTRTGSQGWGSDSRGYPYRATADVPLRQASPQSATSGLYCRGLPMAFGGRLPVTVI